MCGSILPLPLAWHNYLPFHFNFIQYPTPSSLSPLQALKKTTRHRPLGTPTPTKWLDINNNIFNANTLGTAIINGWIITNVKVLSIIVWIMHMHNAWQLPQGRIWRLCSCPGHGLYMVVKTGMIKWWHTLQWPYIHQPSSCSRTQAGHLTFWCDPPSNVPWPCLQWFAYSTTGSQPWKSGWKWREGSGY